MNENRNLFVAIGLSIMVLLGWQYLVVTPQEAKRRAALEAEQSLQVQNEATRPQSTQAGTNALTPQVPGTAAPSATAPAGSAALPGQASIAEALTANPRTPIATKRLEGSINLTGGRIDDILLRDYRETIEDNSPLIRLFNPVGSTSAYFAETGFVAAAGGPALPNSTTLWKVDGNSTLSVGQPVTLTYDNGAGLSFRRTFEVDENYLFTVTDTVANSGSETVTIYPYGIVSRRGGSNSISNWILHEGPIGVFGEEGLREVKYKDFESTPVIEEPYSDKGWLGITDKYWAATLVPPSDLKFKGRFAAVLGETPIYQADFLSDGLTVAPGASASAATQLFAGAKETALLDRYQDDNGIERFELLIDWGWFYFLTKYLFYALDYLFRVFGNFGVAILIVTVGLKIVFFWFANRSYVSMSRMKLVQPRLKEIQERYKDDKPRQQQELMKLYKEEKINPLAGCWPVLIQIPVFFSLYKVLFVTIEMRHAPFFGWIQDLAAPDPTSIFNLFGLIPIDLPTWMPVLGVWPLVMGITMFIQMKLNPAPPDPTQQMIFNWMPVIFTFMLASFPAGLVIYWAWNNTLSVIQQYVIMRRQGVEVDILGNVVETFRGAKKKPDAGAKAGKTGASDKS